MGYTTKFTGSIKVDPILSVEEIAFLYKFSMTRRMNRMNGPYYIDGTGYYGQGRDPDIIDFSQPPPCQPNLWCKWMPNEKGNAIEWNGREKFYDPTLWMKYLINHFVGRNPIAAKEMPFFTGHNCNGIIRAQGQDADDKWVLLVSQNTVSDITLSEEKLEWMKENKINLRTKNGQMAFKLRWA